MKSESKRAPRSKHKLGPWPLIIVGMLGMHTLGMFVAIRFALSDGGAREILVPSKSAALELVAPANTSAALPVPGPSDAR